jgi:predicted GH43/DUF377 family glycosyl hydrolase
MWAKMKNIILLLIIISFFSYSCTEKQTSQPESKTGSIQLNLNKDTTPSDVALIIVELQNDEFENRISEVNPLNSNSNDVAFSEVEVGVWNVEISAYNADEELIYYGTANISVIAGETTVAAINLRRVSGSSTGAVFITITWDDSSLFNWFDYPANPILKTQNTPTDTLGIAQPYILKTDGKYFMWYTGLSPNKSHIYAATSDDGINWTPYSKDPVFWPDSQSTWENRYVGSCVVIKVDGVFRMYYSGRNSSESQYSPWYIGLAVSTDGFHWTRRKDPVFSGILGQWDLKITTSDIEIIDDTYYMYYTGKSYTNDHKIGIATSADGITWERYGGNPIFSNYQTWEGSGFYNPSVLKIGNTYYMVYMNSNSEISGFGFAKSTNAIDWVKEENNPFITSKDTYANWERILYPNLIETDNEYRLYYTGYKLSQNERSICVLRSFK